MEYTVPGECSSPGVRKVLNYKVDLQEHKKKSQTVDQQYDKGFLKMIEVLI